MLEREMMVKENRKENVPGTDIVIDKNGFGVAKRTLNLNLKQEESTLTFYKVHLCTHI